MENQTLEKEFETFKALHKYAVLKAKLIMYYMDLHTMQGKLNLPPFILRENAERYADKDLRELLTQPDGMQRFNSLYKSAWDSIAEYMD